MNRDLLILLVVGIVVVVLLTRRAPASDPTGVTVQMGAHGARIDYGAETGGHGCCG
ncbi:MAG: hypothetical protein WDA16_05930 [Candidatus Thermoplasmatota archaeon]